VAQQASFEAIKAVLQGPEVLTYPDFSRKFFIEVDVSAFGIGGVLMQLVEGVPRGVVGPEVRGGV
jgi:hypothetical protein